MPELPEVETIINDLRPEIQGLRFTGATLRWPRMALRPEAEELCCRLQGKRITEVTRRGKYLLFRLDSGETLVLHMRMTGSLLLTKSPGPLKGEIPYTTAVFSMDNGTELVFCDRRKLGTAMLTDDEGEISCKLGLEPLSPEFTPEALAASLKKRKAPVKAILCDQKVVAGIGNMYADEALFLAGINPLRQAASLSRREIGKLHRSILRALESGIANAGATFSDYRRPGGEPGSQQNSFYVAHRRGQLCRVCSHPIERIAVRNRGTYFCPRCQPGVKMSADGC